jgi:chemotaxis protein histidine kinase CheA
MSAMTEPGFAAQLAQDLDPEDLRVVLGVFRQDVIRLTAALDDTIAAADIDGFRRTCHALAGAAGAVGVMALEQSCRATMSRAALSLGDLPAIAAEIRRLGTTALAETTAFLATLPEE